MEHVIWTKLAIAAIVYNSHDKEFVIQRLLRNPNDFAKAFEPYYGPQISHNIGEIIKEHLLIAADLVVAAKNNDSNAPMIEKKFYANADKLANYLNSINPYWSVNDIKKMMYNHLALVKAEAVAIIKNNYEDAIRIFDENEKQALMMADQYTDGIIRQFGSNTIRY